MCSVSAFAALGSSNLDGVHTKIIFVAIQFHALVRVSEIMLDVESKHLACAIGTENQISVLRVDHDLMRAMIEPRMQAHCLVLRPIYIYRKP